MNLHCLHISEDAATQVKILQYLKDTGARLYSFFNDEELMEFMEVNPDELCLIVKFETRRIHEKLSDNQLLFIKKSIDYIMIDFYPEEQEERLSLNTYDKKFMMSLIDFEHRNISHEVSYLKNDDTYTIISYMSSILLINNIFQKDAERKVLLKLLNHRYQGPPSARVLSFPPHQKQAGIQILSYFQEILNQKYPDVEASVKISQNGNMVTMEVETADGQKELIEKTFEEYQLVISGKKPAEEFLDNKLQIAALENEVRIALMRVENAQNLLQVQSDQIDDLKQDKKSLQLQLAEAMRGNQSLQKELSKLVKAVIKNNNVEHVFRMLELRVGAEPTEDQVAEIRKELEAIKKKEPKAFKDFVKNVTAGIVTNVTSPWFINLVNSMPV